jgi:hypothetical protein
VSARDDQTQYALTNGSTSSARGDTINVTFAAADMHAIKQRRNLCTLGFNCHIRIGSVFADAFGNPSVTIPESGQAILVDELNRDTIGAALISFDLDLIADTMTFTFNEPVRALELDSTKITLRSSADVATSLNYELSGAARNSGLANDGLVSQIYLELADVLAIKATLNLGTSVSDTFVTVVSGLVDDLEDNDNLVIPNTEYQLGPVQVTGYETDTVPPTLVGFTAYDPTTGEIALSFNEPVDISTFTVGEITFHSTSAGIGSSHTLAGDELSIAYESDLDKMSIVFTIAQSDLRIISLDGALAATQASTYITFSSDMITDMSGAAVNPVSREQVEIYGTVEEAAVLSYTLDLVAGHLNMTFSGVVDTSTLNPTYITLHNSGTVSASDGSKFTLTADSETNSLSGFFMLIELCDADLNEIKRRRLLCTSEADTFMSLDALALRDLAARQILPIDEATGLLQVSGFTADTTPPVLNSFEFTAHPGTITMVFSEVVDLTTFDVESIAIHSSQGSSSTSRLLTGGTYSPMTVGITVTVTLTPADLNAIKYDAALAINEQTTNIVINSSLVNDLAGNPVTAIGVDAAQVTSDYTEDGEAPTLVLFDLDLTAEILRLSFSETVRFGTLQPGSLVLQSTAAGGIQYTLTGGTASEVTGLVVQLSLTLTDLNEIKALVGLGGSSSNTFLAMSADAIEDANTNGVASTIGAGLLVNNYTPDETSPVVTGFDLDMDTARLTIRFSETVNGNSFRPAQITLQNTDSTSALISDESHSLSAASVLEAAEINTTLVVLLSDADMDEMKNVPTLVSAEGNTFMSIASGTFSDMNSRPLGLINSTSAMAVTTYTADGTPPILTAVAVNMNRRLLTLNFDEPVDTDTLVYTSLKLQSGASSGTLIALTGGNVTRGSDGMQIVVRMLDSDVHRITQADNLAVDQTSSNLVVVGSGIEDMASNGIVALPTTGAKPADAYTEDTTDPELVSFSIDMDAEEIVLTFNETMDVSSIAYTGIVLQAFSNSLVSYRLTTGALLEQTDDLTVRFSILLVDLNELKVKNIGQTQARSWLSMDSATITDMNGQPVVPLVVGATSMNADDFTADTTAPVLRSFDLSVDNSTAELRFSESVDTSEFLASELSFHSQNTVTKACPCSICFDNEFMVQNCTEGGSVDTHCQLCDICDANEFLVTPCSSDADTVCQACQICGDGFYMEQWCTAQANTVCVGCADNNCQSCSGPNDMCQECKTGFVLLDGTCISECPSGMFPTATSAGIVCDTCHGTCATCNGAGQGNCVTCPHGLTDSSGECSSFCHEQNEYQLVICAADENNNDGTCVDVCPDGTYQSSELWGDVCQPCSRTCLTCTGPATTDCIDCDFDNHFFIMDGGVCTNICLPQNQYQPPGGAPCADCDGSCDQCVGEGPANCVACATGLVKQDGICVNSCDADRYLDTVDNTCKANPCDACHSTCAKCSGPGGLFRQDCTVCAVGFVRHNGQCIGACPPDYELDTDDNTCKPVVCDACHSTCATCFGPAADECTTCTGVGVALLEGSCVSDCLSGSFADSNDNICKACGAGCTSCSAAYGCDVCTGPFDNENSTCFVSVIPGSIDWDNLAEAARPPLSHTPEPCFVIEEPTSYTLALGSYTLSGDGPSITAEVSWEDLNELKVLTSLTVSASSTWMSFGSAMISDMDGNAVTEVDEALQCPSPCYGFCVCTHSFIQVTDYTADTTQPILSSFSLSVTGAGSISFNFSEAVDPDTLDMSKFLLQSAPGVVSDSVVIVGGALTVTARNQITVPLQPNDLNAIKANRALAIDSTSTFISVVTEGIYDYTDYTGVNGVVPIATSSPLQVDVFTADGVDPELVAFGLNMTSGVLTLSYSETVDAVRVAPTSFSLQGGATGTGTRIALDGGEISSVDDTVTFITITHADMNLIKQDITIATSNDSTFLTFPSDAVRDTTGNRIVAVPVNNAIQASLFSPDVTSPEVVSYGLNMNSGVLTISFSETVNGSSVQVEHIAMQAVADVTDDDESGSGDGSSSGDQPSSVRLTTSTPALVFSDSIAITLSLADLNELKRVEGLCTGTDDTFMAMGSNCLVDMNTNSIVQVDNTAAMQASAVVVDETDPVLASAALDMNAKTLTLSFTETVDVSTLAVTAITIQPTANVANGVASVTLSGNSGSSSVDGHTVVVNIANADANEIKRITALATSSATSYVVATSATIKDMNNNPLVGSDVTAAFGPASFVPDTTPPELESFDLNMDTAVITLRFSETVDATSVSPADFVLVNGVAMSDALSYVRLPPTAVVSSSNSHTIEITIPTLELDALKIRYFGTVHLVMGQTAVYDMAGNSVVSHPDGAALAVSSFVADSESPELIGFDVAMPTGRPPLQLTLSFSESVNIASFNISGLVLQSTETGVGAQTYQSARPPPPKTHLSPRRCSSRQSPSRSTSRLRRLPVLVVAKLAPLRLWTTPWCLTPPAMVWPQSPLMLRSRWRATPRTLPRRRSLSSI